MPLTAVQVEKRDSLLLKREKYFAKMQALYDMAKNVTNNNFPIFKSRYLVIKDLYSDYDNILNEIDALSVTFPSEDRINTISFASAFDELYYYIEAIASKYKKELGLIPATPKTEPGDKDPIPNVRLPKIDLPKFNGVLTHWTNFKDSYISLIHSNKSLSNIDKYNYLRASLTGAPLDIISHIAFDGEHYMDAWKALTKQYDNMRVLASHFLENIFECPTLKGAAQPALRQFVSVYRENIASIKKLNIPDPSEFVYAYVGLKKLDNIMRMEFEKDLKDTVFPTSAQLIDFLESKCKIMEISSFPSDVASSRATPSKAKGNSQVRVNSFLGSNDSDTCPLCHKGHRLIDCHIFLKKSISGKHSVVKRNKLCYNCLSSDHSVRDCSSNHSCKTCKGRHHSLLHFFRDKSVSDSSQASSGSNRSRQSNSSSPSDKSVSVADDKAVVANLETSSSGVLHSNSLVNSPRTLLGTVLLNIRDAFGHKVPFRAILDCGSQKSFLTKEFVNHLGFQPLKSHVIVAGIGASSILPSKGMIKTSVSPRLDDKCEIPFVAEILSNLTNQVPSAPLPDNVRQQFARMELADPSFDIPGPIQGLLGNDIFARVLLQHQPHLSLRPAAISTIFGVVIMGSIPEPCTLAVSNGLLALLVNEPSPRTPDLSQVMDNFWKTEEPSVKTIDDPEHVLCEKHFVETHSRDPSGRYIVRYPFRKEFVPPTSDHQLALNRLRSQERRFKKFPDFAHSYKEFMREYIDLDHMRPTNEPSRYIIPHHAVHKPDSLTTKVRVVFDASAKQHGGVSLNDGLMAGPTIQTCLADIVCNFRLHLVAFSADIAKMYRQVLIHQDDQCYQHVVWRENPDSPVQTFALQTVTYGVTSASFQAIRALVQCSIDEGARCPEAARILHQDTHVDDIVSGTSSIEEALQLQRELTELCAAGGFELRKWLSNDSTFMDAVSSQADNNHSFPLIDSGDTHKVLGILWFPKEDVFSYSFSNLDVCTTKRGILSGIARLYDPLGWIAAVIFFAKCFMQRLWRLSVEWDEQIPEDMASSWHSFVEELPALSELRIPRHIFLPAQTSCYVLGFCDASELGYGCAIYLRTSNMSDDVRIELLKARTKVAPLKILTIPRLELCGALLLVRTLVSLKSCFDRCPHHCIRLFTDSSTVLNWLRIEPHKLKTFVAHRVEEISQAFSRDCWAHVSTSDNPADFASRGLLPREIVNCDLWWRGPPWALSHPDCWPKPIDDSTDNQEIPELKTNEIVGSLTTEPNWIVDLINNSSRFYHLIRVVGWILRFITNCRKRTANRSKTLSLMEIRNAKMTCIGIVQRISFHKELEEISAGKVLRRSLQSLAPFVDSSGFLRVGGRLSKSSLSWSAQHPLLLSKQTHFTKLLVEYFHISYLHVGPQTLQALVSRDYWIVGGRSLFRKVVRICHKCFKFRAQPKVPLMADLPEARVNQPARAFCHVGVDFAGPLPFKTSSLRKAAIGRAYFCVFICLATKAVHLELVSSLSTAAFLACLDRFASRRGAGHHMYSDQGTNFVGAARHLKEVKEFCNSVKTPDFVEGLNQRSITWHFNPPFGPHFGGLWEAAVKSVKTHLVRLVDSQPLTFEECVTVLSKIEAILNSRPLCPLSGDPSDLEVLTPGHFLVGGPLVAVPEIPLLDVPMNRLRRWQLVQRISQQFWRRWSVEYLHTLQVRNKWTKPSRNFQVGDLVLMKSPNLPVMQWITGRIVKTHQGSDGIVRVVVVRTSSGEYKRPVASLVLFPDATDV